MTTGTGDGGAGTGPGIARLADAIGCAWQVLRLTVAALRAGWRR